MSVSRSRPDEGPPLAPVVPEGQPLPAAVPEPARLSVDEALRRIGPLQTVQREGRLRAQVGTRLRARLAGARVGEIVTIRSRERELRAEVVGFDDEDAILLALERCDGLAAGSPVLSQAASVGLRLSPRLCGRVLGPLGEPLDGALPDDAELWTPSQSAPDPLTRRPIADALETGLRVVDALLPFGLGQRLALLSPAGAGKSRLLAQMCQSRGVDRVVLALVGERGVEIAHAVRELFATAGTERTVLVVASSELPPRARVRAALTATAIAEYFRDRHHERVLLAIDSLSRVARAQREVGLAVGELPVRQGYPPSVFELLPQLVERAGNGAQGRMSALYTLLSESELDDPMAAELASLVDGQLVLSARLAAQGFFPAIDVLRSLSRNAERLLPAAAVEVGRRLRAALATLEAKERLVDAGVVSPASDPELARLLALKPRLLDFLRQPSNEHCPREQSLQGLAALGL